MAFPGSSPPNYPSTPPRPNNRPTGQERHAFVVFEYNERKCLFPKPTSHDAGAAATLVRDYLVNYDQSRSEVRFMARMPHVLADEDVEIMPPAWAEVCHELTQFRVVVAEKEKTQSQAAITSTNRAPSPIPIPKTKSKKKSPLLFALKQEVEIAVTNLSGTHICTISASIEEQIAAIQTKIEQQAYIPVRRQTLLHGDTTLLTSASLSQYTSQNPIILRLCRNETLCEKCSCGGGTLAEVEEVREIEEVVKEIQLKKRLERERDMEAWRMEKKQLEEAEALCEIERRRNGKVQW